MRIKKKDRKNISKTIIGIDMDETLCHEVCWTPEQCVKARPNKKMVKLINRLYDLNFIVIYTARRDYLMEATIKFLRDNSIKFHAISNNKIPLGAYIDNDSYTVNDFK